MARPRPKPRPRKRVRFGATLTMVCVLWTGLAACVTHQPAPVRYPAPPPVATPAPELGAPVSPRIVRDRPPMQCVPFAREVSGIALRGDAHTWWGQAAGRYARGSTPAPGAVLSLHSYAGPDRGHLAVVTHVLEPRLILVDHANWHNSGEITLGAPVRDESEANDWTLVRVWNAERGEWGARLNPAHGFIGPAPEAGPFSWLLRPFG